MSHTPAMSESSQTTRVAAFHPDTMKYPPPAQHDPSIYTLSRRPWRFYVTPFENILRQKYQGSGTEADPYLVDWLPDDPEDPQQWQATYKWFTIAVASFATLAVALSSSAYSGGVQSLMADFGVSSELLTAGLSLFVVGFAFGPLLWAPLSEVYGRRVIYWTTYVMLTLWTAVTAASQNVAQVLVFRCLSGLFGSSPLANAGGTIADVLDQKQRGIGMAFFAAAPFLGPALGPISGGFLGLTSGWRWVEGFLAIFCGVLTIVLFLFSPETYAPKILRDRALRLERATGKVYRFRADAKGVISVKDVLKVSLIRPWKFLIREPIVIALSLYTAIIYGILYLEFEAYPLVFGARGWNPGEIGLAFLGLLVGVVLSVVVNILFINPQYLKTIMKRGKPMPEDRLPPAIWGGVLLVIGLAGFAATNGPDVHWIAPIIFGIPFGLGMVVVFLACLGYLIESYTIYAASVLAANSVLRSLFGAAFPLFTPYMYRRLGIHWASALPGFLALACIPFTVLFYKYGAQIRAKCKYSADAERQMAAIIAAKMAAVKQQKDEEAAIEDHTATTTQVDAQPAENIGGQGDAEVEKEKIKDPQHHDKEWDEYAILADRDMWDMQDEERLRLEELHKKFEYAKAKPTA